MEQTTRKPKPPACDACKTRKVLCHRQPNGLPCPRCVEHGILCTTTFVPRGRPKKNASPAIVSYNVQPQNPNMVTSDPTLPPELVKHLFECFTRFPQCRHPLLQLGGFSRLKAALAATSWEMDHLPVEARVLSYCVCALSSTMSFHLAILGPGPAPTSFSDSSVFYPGSDLRGYGLRRADSCRVLIERAIAVAGEAQTYLEASEYNALSCFILGTVEEFAGLSSRRWAPAYISHLRSVATDPNMPNHHGLWAAFLMLEAVTSTLERRPILITHNDQLLLSGVEQPALENVFDGLSSMMQANSRLPQIILDLLRPVAFHVTRLCRELYDKITGDYARRNPISEAAVINFLASLSILRSIVSRLFTYLDAAPAIQLPSTWVDHGKPPGPHQIQEITIACIAGMTIGFTGLLYSLHRELDHRLACFETQMQTQWEVGRLVLLQQQTHAMMSSSVDYVARTLEYVGLPLDFMHAGWTGVQGWAKFCLEEADTAGGVSPARFVAFQRILNCLKGLAYSRHSAELSTLIDRMEAHVAAYTQAALFSNESTNEGFQLDCSWNGLFADI